MDNFDLSKYIDMAFRRKWWIIFSFMIVMLCGLTYVMVVPKTYEAETVILVQPQRVPKDFVRSIVPNSIEYQLQTISEQVTSRTNLEGIIKQFGLFEDKGEDMLLEEKVALMKGQIQMDVSQQPGKKRDETDVNSFTIRFQYTDAEKTMQVTNALASNFITENLRMRESQAIGTTGFLADELESVRKELARKEEELKRYREKYMGALPEQLNTNLKILERLQNEQDRYSQALRNAENKKAALQKEAAEAARELQETDPMTKLKRELALLEVQYTANHPDIIRLKESIAKLEAERAQGLSQTPVPLDSFEARQADNRLRTARRELVDIDLRIRGLKDEILKRRPEIKMYQQKVEDTPRREQELLGLRRDYDNLRKSYNTMLNKKLEAQITVSMEKKQKGEQFRILDPARLPRKPVKPDMRKVLLLTLVLGLSLGGGLACLAEGMDSSFRSPEDLENDLDLPVLVSMPIRYTERERRLIKFKKSLAYVSVSLGFLAAVAAIVVATKGFDETVKFVSTFLEGV